MAEESVFGRAGLLPNPLQESESGIAAREAATSAVRGNGELLCPMN
jgi:hypothetical protein